MNSSGKFGAAVIALLAAAIVLLAINLTITIPTYSAATSVQTAYLQGLPFKVYPEEGKALTVTGIGTASAKPDRVIISLSVVTRGSTANEAQSLNAEKMGKVISALKEAGVSEDQMKTTSYTLNPIYEYPERKSPIIVGYECRNSLRITLEEIDRAGEIVDLAVSAGANQVSSISFTLSDEAREKLKAKALKLAVEEAKAKAEAIAEAMGIKLVGPKKIMPSEGYIPIPRPEVMLKGEAGTQIIPPEELKVTVTVTVVYEFE